MGSVIQKLSALWPGARRGRESLAVIPVREGRDLGNRRGREAGGMAQLVTSAGLLVRHHGKQGRTPALQLPLQHCLYLLPESTLRARPPCVSVAGSLQRQRAGGSVLPPSAPPWSCSIWAGLHRVASGKGWVGVGRPTPTDRAITGQKPCVCLGLSLPSPGS